MLAAQWLNLDFVREVVASTEAVNRLIPSADVAIELGGEDAKITYFRNPVEQRMNVPAGGTGAFIDQMAILLKTDASGLNEYAKQHTRFIPLRPDAAYLPRRHPAAAERGCCRGYCCFRISVWSIRP